MTKEQLVGKLIKAASFILASTKSYYIGTRDGAELKVGMCLTESEDVATSYARAAKWGGGVVNTIEIDMDGLTCHSVGSYDREVDTAPGDDGNAHGADVLVYADEDPSGNPHTTWRLMSDRALSRATIL